MGFYMNPLTGQWSKKEAPEEEEEGESEDSRTPAQLIVPYVEDHRNILILTPASSLRLETMATLQAALRRGIERVFQIEESELAVEPLPDSDVRKSVLLYESAEGGAGVLNRLATDENLLALVARATLNAMHFNVPLDQTPFTLDELRASEILDEKGQRICEAGCYQCLLSYFNQPDHSAINRRDEDLLSILTALAHSQVRRTGLIPEAPPKPSTNDPAGGWADWLQEKGCVLPEAFHVPINKGVWTAHAHYVKARTYIFLDAPPAEAIQYCEDRGAEVIIFPADQSEWESILQQHAALFNPA